MARKQIIISVLALALSLQAVFSITPAQAATIAVTSKLDTADPGKCRLRDAIIAANTNTATGDCPAGVPGMDTIGFSLGIQCNLVPCTITLTSALPTVTEDLTINGNNTSISGANLFRVFDLGVVAVHISNLSIKNGNVSDFGGAINMSDATSTAGTALTLDHAFFSNNHADYGGAIYAPRGTLTIVNSNFSGNFAGSSGGAILEERNGTTLTVVGSIFNNNTAGGDGGAMVLVSDALISGSSFSGNSSVSGGAITKIVLGDLILDATVFNNNVATGKSGASGGAIYTFQNVGSVSLTNVTISGNSANFNGGGIFNNVVPMFLNNVTISNNTADSDNDGNGDGGGIFKDPSPIQVQNSIVAGNFDTPGNAGGGIMNPDCSGTFTTHGYNLIGRNDGCSGFVDGVNGDQVGTGANPIDPQLNVLADHGGPTLTHALLPGSPAINAGNPLTPGSGGFACAAADQRGIIRPQGSACDIGAYEFVLRSFFLPLIQSESH